MAELPAQVPAVPLTEQQHLARVIRQARVFAVVLQQASEAGVSHALILPQLMLVFRTSFGAPPANMAALLAELGGGT